MGGQGVELGPGAGQRLEETVGALVAICSKFGEALVDQRKTALDLRNHALGGAVLFRHAGRQPAERAVRMVDIIRERLGRVGSGLADARGRLRDQGCDSCCLNVDPSANLFKRCGRPVEQRIERSRIGRLGVVDARRGIRARRFDLGEPGRKPVGRLRDKLVGASRAVGKLAHLSAEVRSLVGRFAADCPKLVGHGACGLLGAR